MCFIIIWKFAQTPRLILLYEGWMGEVGKGGMVGTSPGLFLLAIACIACTLLIFTSPPPLTRDTCTNRICLTIEEEVFPWFPLRLLRLRVGFKTRRLQLQISSRLPCYSNSQRRKKFFEYSNIQEHYALFKTPNTPLKYAPPR
jgi:hypothetical protein